MAKSKPRYRNKTINKIKNKVTGEVGHDQLNSLLDPDSEVTLIVHGTVSKVHHDTSAEGMVVTQTIKTLSGYVVTDELDAADLLHKLHAERATELDNLLGTTSGEEGQ